MSDNIIPQEAVVISDTIAPCEKTPVCTREFFLRPPDWRFQQAIKYLDTERNHEIPVIPTDPLVQFLIRILRAERSPHNKEYVMTLWPDICAAIHLGTNGRHSAITAELESYIIAGKEDEYPICKSLVEIYKKVFFDLSGITAIHSWMHDFLIAPEQYASNSILLRARMLSYYGVLVGSDIFMGALNSDVSKLMKSLGDSERQRRLFDYMSKITKIDNTNYMLLMEAAVKSMTERDFQEHMKDRDEAGSSSLEELAEHLEQGIRAFSQQEIEKVSETGLDFVNQYTAAILREDKENGN
jgi:hypothetical protein